MSTLLKRLFIVFAVLATALSFGGTLTVTSPAEGGLLGKTNTVAFTVSGATNSVTVKVVATYPGGGTKTSYQAFTPDVTGTVVGSLPLNFESTAPEGLYTLDVSAKETGNTYDDVILHVNVDVVAPKFEEFSPNEGAYVKGVVKIRGSIRETHLDFWTVQVNGQDIPNNTGTSSDIAVDWDTSTIPADGPQTITVKVTDKAGNTSTKVIDVTLDRVAPDVTIVYPRADTHILNGTTINVLVDIQDAGSIDGTGIDVLAKSPTGLFLARVTIVSIRQIGAQTYRWTGRIRYRKGRLPAKFNLVATATDRAGNQSLPQQVTLTISR